MLFQVRHVHTNEHCPGASDELGDRLAAWWAELKANPEVKVLSGYVSPMDHTLFITVEADAVTPLTRALGPLNSIGSGYVTPVVTLDETMPLTDEGVFQLPDA